MIMGIISSSVALAISMPLAINGRIESSGNVGGLNVLIENTANGDTLVKKTTSKGEYLADASEFDNTFFIGSTIRVTITECAGSPQCVKTIQWTGQDELFLLFNIDEEILPPEPEPQPEPEEEQEPENKATPGENKGIATAEAFLGQTIDIKLDDSKISSLIDGEIYFDGENYEVKEEIYFNGVVKTSIDDEDFGKNTYLTIEEFGIEYRYIFDEYIDLAQITEDKPLDLEFLGKDIKIIKASANEITVRSGEEYFLAEKESKTISGKKLTVNTIGKDSVLLNVEGLEQIVKLNQDKEINGLKIHVDEILYKDYAAGFVELIVGEETDKTVKNGDFFELFIKDDEEWEWIVELGGIQQYIGIWNVEAYSSIDEDEIYKAIPEGGILSLPNDYLRIKFKEIENPERNELDFEVNDKDGKDYLYVKGNQEDTFIFGTEEYDKLYINSTGIYNKDLVLITTDKVEIGNSGIFLELGSAIIVDLKIELDLSDISFKGVSFKGKDQTFMDYLGIIFSDPEQAVENKDGFEVSVPEEMPEVLIEFGKELLEEIIEEPIEEVPKDEVIKDKEKIITEPEVKEKEIVVVPGEKEIIEIEKLVPNIAVIAAISIVILGLLALWNYFKNTEARGIYKWMPGMAAIIEKLKDSYIESAKVGDADRLKKLEGTLLKYSATITKKYLENLIEQIKKERK